MRLIERDFYLNKLKDVMGTPDIKVITGVRRSGKSKLLEAFMAHVLDTDPGANIIHINFNMTAYEGLNEYHALNDYRQHRTERRRVRRCLFRHLHLQIF